MFGEVLLVCDYAFCLSLKDASVTLLESESFTHLIKLVESESFNACDHLVVHS